MPPLIPSGNQNQFFGQKVSKLGVNVNSAGDNELILKDDYSSRIYYNNNGVETVLLGLRRANSTNGIGTDQQGLFVSQDGINVTNATDSQLVFNSGQDVFKIVKILTPTWTYNGVNTPAVGPSGTGTNASDGQSFSTAHGQTFIPAFLVYATFTRGSIAFYVPIYNESVWYSINGINNAFTNIGIVLTSTWNIYADATNINIGINTNYAVGQNNSANGVPATTFNFKIYVLQETIT